MAAEASAVTCRMCSRLRCSEERISAAIANVAGTGPEGRVVAEDVERAAASGPTIAPGALEIPGAVAHETQDVRVEQLSSMRKPMCTFFGLSAGGRPTILSLHRMCD